MFTKTRSWDNRESRRKNGRLQFTDGRSWTRRVQWLKDGDLVKLKFEAEGGTYMEVLATQDVAEKSWAAFKEGKTLEECALFTTIVPTGMKSKRASGS